MAETIDTIAIIFDIDDTLYLRTETYLRAYREFFEGKPGLDEEKLLRVNRIHREELFRMRAAGQISMEEMLIERTRRTFAEFGVEMSGADALRFEHFYEQNQKRIEMRPALRRLLEDLADADCVLGVLTNGPSDRQREKLRAVGGLRYFPEDRILASGDVGVIKPDLAIFRAYEQKTGLRPSQLWMVGDSYEADIAGAKHAGWHAVWLDRAGTTASDNRANRAEAAAADDRSEGKQSRSEGKPSVLAEYRSSREEDICAYLRRKVNGQERGT